MANTSDLCFDVATLIGTRTARDHVQRKVPQPVHVAREATETVWPANRSQRQPLDRKTNEYAGFLFAYWARDVAKHYINTAIIPILCGKAGVPTADVRRNITGHRARSTSASQLCNAQEPMTLFELQERLGHRTPEATTPYAKLTPEHPDQAYNDAGCLARDMRTVEVIDDRAAADDGQAALDQLLERRAGIPTPAGPTPRRLGAPATASLAPMIKVRGGGPGS
jgi:hypothetical protein